jgi:hypothetical protein
MRPFDRRPHIELMRRQAMAQDLSWARSADANVKLYATALSRRGY